MTSVERALEYAKIPSEAPLESKSGQFKSRIERSRIFFFTGNP